MQIFLLHIPVQAQDGFLRGKLLDNGTREPVVFATIRLKNRAVGVITNQDGGFRFPLRFQKLGDTLEISCMGYQKKVVPISRLSNKTLNIIRIDPGLLELEEAVVMAKKKRSLSARGIVKKAIAAIPKNYPGNTFSTVGYYRDYQMSDGHYVNLNEAILEVFDMGFDTLDSVDTKVMIYDYQKNLDFKRDTLADNPYDYDYFQKIIERAYMPHHDGNEFNILRVHDPIRNYKINSFDLINKMEEDFLKNHSFKREADIVLDDELLYTIKCNKLLPIAHAIGHLYISKSDYAIHKIEYAVYDRLKKVANGNKKGAKGNLIFETNVEYKRNPEGKMFLNYISFHNTFRLSPPPKFTVDSIRFQPNSKALMVFMNNKLYQNAEPENKSNYEIRFKGNKLKLRRIKVFKDVYKVFQDSLMIYLDEPKAKLNRMAGEIKRSAFTANGARQLLEVEIKNLNDVNGNVLNAWESLEFNQFREYFVQEIRPYTRIPENSFFMDKNRPIFESQPLIRPKDYGEYWMNTPLENVD